ncbi:LysR substrate-binding domain-containing protein [Streptomyces cocklensis]|uniref:LysR family transcriptional regulator n=1 Tax=Actinacidiphila cocklensis TaxID=887465 RepID=A0A9W4E9T0_9ACTN|nr:LysR family transcriptional regulator [Actinacidiphila cocklensis]MDD1063807.1 LysR substrate-binding domain-containing protein [Actinacidiphila cocklensis]CAG6396598.1 LysR family transcriptional regulator [Actinacidiphila cocklensis]
MRELDVNRLRVLVEVAHAASIAEAARRLAFTPSALSQQIAKLEAELGARLLERRPTGVTLTPIGEVLVGHGERVLGELRQARAAVEAALGDQPQRLALGTFATAGQVLVPAALASLQRRYPRAELSLVDLEPPDGYGLVASGDLDALITHRYPGVPPTPHPGLDKQPLLSDSLVLALPADHRLAAGAPSGGVGLDRLGGDTWISGGPGTPNRVCLETIAGRAGVSPRVAYESADYHAILALVGAGLGITLVPQSVLAGAAHSRVAVRRLRGLAPAREISILHRRRPTALVRELTAFLHSAGRGVAGAGGAER